MGSRVRHEEYASNEKLIIGFSEAPRNTTFTVKFLVPEKRGRPIGAKDVVPRKRKTIGHASEVANVPDNTPEMVSPPEEFKTPEVAVTKPPEVVLPLKEDIAPEVAHIYVKTKVPESYEVSLCYLGLDQ
ncbi:hypothetical protein AgCh_031273 [Apium graveolens]